MRDRTALNAPKMITATSTEHNIPSSYAFLNSPFFRCTPWAISTRQPRTCNRQTAQHSTQSASAQQHSSATQSMRHTSTAAPAQRIAKTLRTQLALRKVTERLRSCYQRPREKIESAWRTELREKIARGIEKRDDGNRLADGEGQGDCSDPWRESLDVVNVMQLFSRAAGRVGHGSKYCCSCNGRLCSGS
ncbi:uncharacterized protein FOMMEDRAFT_151283 [Fomitiporia mediterranea MF3/22]|uniref:uncharacterized protein n=1 Tax=Fomitiporia mediterranea (strain MF3/22) TaxID=694068 RepID=UPI00044083CC|nr:uncharacterized protein FOMMEDRAFT_151283 [Fomitiporia mediterranea MF3/22]EJD08426.1 hypothetical protein FOMMEDRAFT_151283 [Fomitiporia mediterranea MF3/22]